VTHPSTTITPPHGVAFNDPFLKKPYANRPYPTTDTSATGPSQLHVFASNQCQLACTFCPGQSPLLSPNLSQQFSKRLLDLDTFKLVWDRNPSLHQVVFSGWGEPLLNPHVLPMADYAWATRQATSTLITNGLLLDVNADVLLQLQGLTVVVSLHGHSPSHYHQLTGMDHGHFSDVVAQVKDLVKQRNKRLATVNMVPNKAGLPIHLAFMVTRQTLGAIPYCIELAEDLGVDGIHLNTLRPLNPLGGVAPDCLAEPLAAIAQQLAHRMPIRFDKPLLNDKTPCLAPSTVLSLDADCVVGNCSRYPNSGQWASTQFTSSPRGWDIAPWEHPTFTALKQAQGQALNKRPLPCQHCNGHC
jgi:MoaA/NifB/PqqE/SkfB family radical SAM enzyme